MTNVVHKDPIPVIYEAGKGFTRSQCLRALRRRRDWLTARTFVREDAGRQVFLDVQELAAIKWALQILEAEGNR